MERPIKRVSQDHIAMVLVQQPQAHLGVPRRALKIQPAHPVQQSVHVTQGMK